MPLQIVSCVEINFKIDPSLNVMRLIECEWTWAYSAFGLKKGANQNNPIGKYWVDN